MEPDVLMRMSAIDIVIYITDKTISWTLPVFVFLGIIGNLFTVWLIRVVKALR